MQQYTSPRRTSGSNPSTESSINNIRKATNKYANAMQGIKATTESREPNDLNNSSTARSDQRKDNQYMQQYTSPRRTSGSNPSTESSINNIRKATNKYANAMQGIKATTESREPNDLNNSSTARSDQRKDNQWPRVYRAHGSYPLISSTPYQMLNRQLHLLLPTHEMWELPTMLIAANKPSREVRYGSYPLSLRGIRELPAHPRSQHLGAKSDAYANRLHKGDVFAHLTSFKKTFENDIQTKRLSKRSPRYHSCSRRSCLSSAIEEDKNYSLLKHASALSTAQRQQILLRLLNTTTTADVTTAERKLSAMTHATADSVPTLTPQNSSKAEPKPNSFSKHIDSMLISTKPD
ncbi:hypothetical protein F511_36420 [Dorcoceras hygrometricum]|uniref:Uncharacterized protein n=1 Tax=Dorcoceras hygrometricum TaxID=472368 RepID=A0A2Z7C785_9LAMI|nr:hypothetical protein F511_36420 [Dorcoceras hygrometricum]